MRVHPALAALLLSTVLITGANATDDAVGHGTINVVLGNEHGIVVLTDSMITLDHHQSPVPGQKLFKLDDRTVCTFAGFASAPGAGDFFYTQSSAIIQEFARQLASSSEPLSVEEKINALSYIFVRQLTALASLRDATRQATDPWSYSVQLTLAGYDPDGSPKIVQVTLNNTAALQHVNDASDDLFWEFAAPTTVTAVSKTLVPRLAGIRNFADALLAHPRTAESIPAIRRYADAMDSDDGQSLTLAEMKDLAVRLTLETSKKDPAVGGANQVAILEQGRVVSVDQATYPPASKMLLDFKLSHSSVYEFDETGPWDSESRFPSVKSQMGTNILFVKCLFRRVRVDIDNNYFSGDVIVDSQVVYDGSEAMQFGSSTVRNCILIIGPHARQDSERVKHLIHDFCWRQVVYRAPKT